MNLKDIETTLEIRDFTKRCLFDESNPKTKIFKKYWEEAKTIAEFKKKVFADTSLKLSQGYAELSRECEDHLCRVSEMFEQRQFKTGSDRGSVMIGNDDFQILIPNNYGDGITRVAIFEEYEFNAEMMEYNPTIVIATKAMYVYADDCNTTCLAAVLKPGMYFTYSYEGMVALVRSEYC